MIRRLLLGGLAALMLAGHAMAANVTPVDVDNATPLFPADSATFTGSVTAIGGVVTLNTTGYGYIEFQFTSVGVGSTFGVQSSNDGVAGVGSTFNTTIWWPESGTTSLGTVANTAPLTTNAYVAPVTGATMRINLAALTSGTVTVVGTLKRGPVPPQPSLTIGTLTTLTGGGVASAAADSGNPVKIGCKVSAPLNALTAANRQDAICSPNGGIYTEEDGRSFSNITTATTTTVKSGIGFVHVLSVNTPQAAATATVYDNTTATGTKIGTFDLSVARAIPLDAAFATGLTIVTVGTADITVTYR